MRLLRTGFEFRMELTRDEVRMLRQFHDLHEIPLGIDAADFQPGAFQLFPVEGVVFIAVAMPFADVGCSVAFFRQSSGNDPADRSMEYME